MNGLRGPTGRAQRVVTGLGSVVMLALGGCSLLMSKPTQQPAFYVLDGAPPAPPGVAAPPAQRYTAMPTLIVNTPVASPGADTPHLMYTRQAHQLEYFAHSYWSDTPARMLAPLLVMALGRDGLIRAAVPSASVAAGDIRLVTQLERLQQDFGASPSSVHFTLRATLLDEATQAVLASRVFDQTAEASTDDPYGGVVAANRAVGAALLELAAFSTQVAEEWSAASTAVDRSGK
jgi:cholesterol transport system auxiliary component